MDKKYIHELLTILNQYTDRETFDERDWVRGGAQQHERLLHVADWCAATWSGDLVHITCKINSLSRTLGAVARKHGRRLVILLPWKENDDPLPRPCRDDDYEESKLQLIPYLDIVDVVIGRSKFIAPEQICLAVVNPINEYATYLYDIGLVSVTSIIAVENSLWQAQVMRSFMTGGYKFRRGVLQHPLCREGYLLPPVG